jgi:hypothetical protein
MRQSLVGLWRAFYKNTYFYNFLDFMRGILYNNSNVGNVCIAMKKYKG